MTYITDLYANHLDRARSRRDGVGGPDVAQPEHTSRTGLERLAAGTTAIDAVIVADDRKRNRCGLIDISVGGRGPC